jgi:hypothetical protein
MLVKFLRDCGKTTDMYGFVRTIPGSRWIRHLSGRMC